MFTTHPLSSGGADVSGTRCLQPTHIAVELANGYHGCSVARTLSSRRRIGGRAMELVNNHEYLLGLRNRGALSIFDASLKFARASYLQESHVQPCEWNREHSVGFLCLHCSDSNLRWLDVCICTDSRVMVVASWSRRTVGSQSGQGSGEAPAPSAPGRVRSAPPRRMSFWKIQVRTRMRCGLPKERVARTSRKCRLQLLDPKEWTLAAYGGFFREKT